jgi:hypothetical protein
MQIAHDESQGVIKYFTQLAFKVLGVYVVSGVNFIARVADALDDKLWLDPFRVLREEEYTRQIQFPRIRGKIHVLKLLQ